MEQLVNVLKDECDVLVAVPLLVLDLELGGAIVGS